MTDKPKFRLVTKRLEWWDHLQCPEGCYFFEQVNGPGYGPYQFHVTKPWFWGSGDA